MTTKKKENGRCVRAGKNNCLRFRRINGGLDLVCERCGYIIKNEAHHSLWL